MINIGIRQSKETSFFKDNLLNICSAQGNILILSYGYFQDNLKNPYFNSYLDTLVANICDSNTTRLYLVGGQHTISLKGIPHEEISKYLADDDATIIKRLSDIAIGIENRLPSGYYLDIQHLYKEHYHAKLAIKADSFNTFCSILLGSSNFTAPSISASPNLDYFCTEADVFLSNIDYNDHTTVSFDGLDFDEFLECIHPDINLLPF